MRSGSFTTSEAAFLAGVDVKTVNKSIDSGVVAARPRVERGRITRRLGMGGVVCLRLEKDLAPVVALSVRRSLLGRVARQPRVRELRQGETLVLDVASARRDLARRLAALRSARRLVEQDPGISRGEPVFRGTRIPVQLVADMLRQGAGEAEIMDGYPALTAEMVRLAPVYAAAHPRRGRPPSVRGWRDAAAPTEAARYPLGELDRSVPATSAGAGACGS